MIQFMDNFAIYGGTNTLLTNGVYAQASTLFATLPDDPDPSATGKVLKLAGTDTQDQPVRKVLTTANPTVGVAMRLWMGSLPNTDQMSPSPMQFLDVGANVHVAVWVRTTGAIFVTRGGFAGTVIASTAGPVLLANAWQHIETKVKIHDTTGTVEIRVDGVPVLTATGLDTASTADVTCRQVAFNNKATNTGASVTMYIKDFITWDNLGSANTDFLGTCQVISLTPNGDNSFNWTPSTGTTGFNLIDDVPPNDDTDYISAADPPPAASSFTLTNLPVDVTSVKALQTMVRARKTDGGDGSLQTSMISGASTGNGTDRPITVAFTYWFDVFETDPATSAAWIPAAVDAAKIKINRTT